MTEMSREELLRAEAIGSEQGWVAPLTQEDKEYFAYLRTVFKRYNIVPSKAIRLEYDFVVRVAVIDPRPITHGHLWLAFALPFF